MLISAMFKFFENFLLWTVEACMTLLVRTSNLTIQAWKRLMFVAQNCPTMRQVKATQAVFVTHGLHHNEYAISKLIAFCALSNSGSLSYASLLFSSIEKPNSFIYNTLIRAYSRSSQPPLALHYFHLMLCDVNVVPDNHTFHFALLGCANANWVILGRQIHNWVLKNGVVALDSHVQTSLVRLYGGCGVMSDAQKVFGEIPLPDMIQWNALMNGYIRCDSAPESLSVFQVMLVQGTEPDDHCCTTALTACAQSGAFWQGKWIHEYMKRKGFDLDVFSGTALVDMYAKCGCIDLAVEVFEGMAKRNVFTWSAMIGGFAVHGYARKAIDCLEKMQLEDRIKPDGVVILGVLMACTHTGLQVEGQSLLENMEARYGIVPKHEHYSCVVDLLCRKGQLDEALHLIRRMPMKPLASVWGALLSSCQTHKNVKLAVLAAKELLELDSADVAEEDAAYVQLSNVYFSAQKNEDACRVRRMIDDKGIKKTPGCSMIEVDGMVSQFLSGDISHPLIAHIQAMLELLFLHSIH